MVIMAMMAASTHILVPMHAATTQAPSMVPLLAQETQLVLA